MLEESHDQQSPHKDATTTISHPPSQDITIAAFPWDFDEKKKNKLLQRFRTQLSSGPATVAAVVLTTPLENIKVRMQTHHFKNAYQCTKYTWKTEGIRGFFAGAIPPIFSVTLVRVTGFSVYQKAKYKIDGAMKAAGYEGVLDYVNRPGSVPTFISTSAFFAAGCVSGAAISVLACPFELAKNVTQSSVVMGSKPLNAVGSSMMDVPARSAPRIGTFKAVSMVLSRYGFKGLYAGFPLHLARDTIGSGIYFAVYENVKQSVRTSQKSEDPAPLTAAAVAGACCGMVSWIATYPLDTMKTRAQSVLITPNTENLRKAVATTFTSKLRGLEVSLMRTALQNALIMTAFEWVKKAINGLPISDDKPGRI